MIETARLTLRRLAADDAGFILELLNDPSFVRYIGDKRVRTVEQARDYIAEGPVRSYQQHGYGLYLVELREAQEPIGICGLLKRDYLQDPDIGFAFLARFRRGGFGFEAARAVLDYGREAWRLRRVAAMTSPDNVASIALLAKLGFSFERTMRVAPGEPEIKLFVFDSRPIAAPPCHHEAEV